MLKNKLLTLFIFLYSCSFTSVYASEYVSKVNISSIIFVSIVVIYNLICLNEDKKKKMILSKIFYLDFSDMNVNYFITNIVRLILILSYYFFIIPIYIDFLIATIQLIIRILKK